MIEDYMIYLRGSSRSIRNQRVYGLGCGPAASSCDIYIYTHVYIYIYIYIHTHTYTHLSISLSLSIYIYIYCDMAIFKKFKLGKWAQPLGFFTGHFHVNISNGSGS